MSCKQKKEFMMCNGAEYCINQLKLNKDIRKHHKIADAYSILIDGIRNEDLEHELSIDEIKEKEREHNMIWLFLREYKKIIEVFCMGDLE